MSAPAVLGLDALPEHEVFPGFRGRMVHGDKASLVWWRIAEGSVLPEHDHPHEQVVCLLEGALELTVAGAPQVLRAGDVLVIPGGVRHSGRALTEVRVLDVFSPVREDYRAIDATG